MIAGPLLSRSQSQFSQGAVSEYVEDSEPEREERRVRQKSQSKQPRTTVPVKSVPAEVIELSDSEKSVRAAPSKLSTSKQRDRPRIIIEILDSSDGMESSHRGGRSLATRNTNPVESSEQIPSMFEGDCTTDDSFPSIREIMKLPRRDASTEPQTAHAAPTSSTSGASVLKERPGREATRAGPSALQESPPSEEGEGALKLGRFAYANPNPMRRTLSKTPSPTERGSAPPAEGQAGTKFKRTPTPTHRFVDDFSDAQLSRLLKCVSCDLTWTVRKTVLQKMKHIQSCAKKNALNDETVKTLIRKELDSLPPVASTSKSSPSSSTPAATPVLDTLLEDVLKDVGKKKPGRRPQVLQTVKSIDETRNIILDKARTLLQGSSSSRSGSVVEDGLSTTEDVEVPPTTQVFTKSSIATRANPREDAQANTTHLYAPSKLAAQASRLHGGVVRIGAEIAAHSDISPLTQASIQVDAAAFSEVPSEHGEDMPPATQVFAPSRFTSLRETGALRRVVTATVDVPMEDPISIHDTDEDNIGVSSPQRPASPRSPPSPNENPHGPSKHRSPTNVVSPEQASPRSSPGERSPSPATDDRLPGPPPQELDYNFNAYDDYDHQWNEWMNDVWDEEDGACLHYVPEAEGAGPSRVQEREEEKTASPRLHRLAPIPEDIPGPSGTRAHLPSSEPPAKKKRRKKAAASEESDAEAAKTSDISQDEINAKMKEAIFKDEALHLRILRYEPIHFDVFLQMAIDLGIPAKRSGLKGKVRAFLDQKAIHFYGADPSKSRTRRTRHP
ncbi:hypothetical protein ACG7TL_003928 [Trametes sanguinea]